jgi:hypothetical protein
MIAKKRTRRNGKNGRASEETLKNVENEVKKVMEEERNVEECVEGN